MNIRDLDLNLLVVFESIHTTGNISRSAEMLELSQPAISNALARLRKQLDDQLFVRRGNGVVATTRAEQIIGPVRDALSIIRREIDVVGPFDPDKTSRHFRLLVADPLERTVMKGLLQEVGTNSRITFELVPPQILQVEDALLSGKCDIALFLMHGKNSELTSISLCAVDLVLIADRTHPRVHEPLNLKELSSEQFVSMALARGKLANSEKVTFWQRLHLRETCQVYRVSSIGPLIMGTERLGIVPRIYAKEACGQFDLQTLDLPIQLSNQQFHMIWPKRSEDDHALTWLREKIQMIFRTGQ